VENHSRFTNNTITLNSFVIDEFVLLNNQYCVIANAVLRAMKSNIKYISFFERAIANS
jgi:hypothetical protein